MNEFALGAHPVAGGFIAWIRKVHKAENEIIKGKGGHPVIYPTKDAAKAAAGDAIVAYLNSPIVGMNAVSGAHSPARSAAERLFENKERAA